MLEPFSLFSAAVLMSSVTFVGADCENTPTTTEPKGRQRLDVQHFMRTSGFTFTSSHLSCFFVLLLIIIILWEASVFALFFYFLKKCLPQSKKRTSLHNLTLNSFTSQSCHGGELRRRFRESACDAKPSKVDPAFCGWQSKRRRQFARRRSYENTFLVKKTVKQKAFIGWQLCMIDSELRPVITWSHPSVILQYRVNLSRYILMQNAN